MATMNISLPDQMKEWVEAQVATGRYANASDVIRDLIRGRQSEQDDLHQWLAREIRKGRDSGIAQDVDLRQVMSEKLDMLDRDWASAAE